jgi:ribonuclease D
MLIKKKYQKSDWSKRPLSTAMLTYAAQDACHLLPLATILEETLRSKGWLSWVKEECEMLSKVRPVPRHNNPLFLKFRGAGSLDPRSLAVLEAILKFRVDVAGRWDRPPFKVLGNTPIFEMVKKKPTTLKDLKDIGGMNPKLIQSLSHSLLKKIEEALNLSDDALPVYPLKSKKPLGARVAKRVKALKEWREQRADRLGIDPSLICNNAQIQTLSLAQLEDPRDLEGLDELRKWQRQHFGLEICTLLKAIS